MTHKIDTKIRQMAPIKPAYLLLLNPQIYYHIEYDT